MDDLVFHDYQTKYEIVFEQRKRLFGEKQAKRMVGAAPSYYQESLTYFKQDIRERIRLVNEMSWYRNNKPYYKVYPDYVTMFSVTDLNVELQDLRLPYDTFCTRFCVDREPKILGCPVLACLLTYTLHDDATAQLTAVTVQRGSTDVPDARVFSTGKLVITTKYSVQELVNYVVDRDDGVYDDDTEIIVGQDFKRDFATILRVCINVGMIATCAGEVEEDVMGKDIADYVAAVNANRPEAAAGLATKARNVRNGRPGFTFGRSEWLLGRAKTPAGTSTQTESVPLSFGHMRRGHYHHYWTGPGRETLIRKWVRPCRVRPELELDPDARPGEHSLPNKQAQDTILGGGS